MGGLTLYPAANRLDRESALRLWTEANTWFSTEEGKKGQIKEGQFADLAVLSDDYFSVPEDRIQDITSVLTLLGGKPVHGDGDVQGSRAAPAPAHAGLVAGAHLRRLSAARGSRRRAQIRLRGRGLRLRQLLRRARPRPCERLGRERAGIGCAQLLGCARLLLLGLLRGSS